MFIRKEWFAVSLLALFLAACSGGSTSGGEADFSESGFVPTDSNTGGITIEINDEILGVGETSGFTVRVFDALNQPVPNIKVACDTELGVALIEPTTRFEVTSSNGFISGLYGCESRGSFEMACTAANRTKFVTVKCSGDTPEGFLGFPGAGGRGLGSGGGVSGSDDGIPGGSDIDTGLRVESRTDQDVGEDTIASDISQISDCDGDTSTIDPEPFTINTYIATILNSTSSGVTITGVTFSVPEADGTSTARYTSTTFSANVFIPPFNGTANGSATISHVWIDGDGSGGKTYVGRSSTIPQGARNVTFTFFGSNESGDAVSFSATVSVLLTHLNNCT